MNARFYFQDPALDIGPICMSNFLAGSNSVVWFGFYLVWVGLEWFNKIYLIRIVWCGFGLYPKPLAPWAATCGVQIVGARGKTAEGLGQDLKP